MCIPLRLPTLKKSQDKRQVSRQSERESRRPTLNVQHTNVSVHGHNLNPTAHEPLTQNTSHELINVQHTNVPVHEHNLPPTAHEPLTQNTSHGLINLQHSDIPVHEHNLLPPTAHEPLTQNTSHKLPSQVEETLAVCPRFRIVLVGNTGVGKSSLVSSVFNIVFNVNLPPNEDKAAIDIAHDRAGKADITREYYSDQNPRFVLHDSMGFEPGSTEKSTIVKSFLEDRAEGKAALRDQVHAIWLCIETPRTGSRLLQTGDEGLLALATQLKIPVIVVFTKYDLLVMEHFRASSHIPSLPDRKVEATKRAEKAFKEVTKDLPFLFAPVSTKDYGEAKLLELTQVTRDHLRGVGSLWALWATAQQINARQKVELSISEGFKKYWRDLGESVFCQGHPLVDCIERIHDDILKVWNFNDPLKLLSGEQFLKGMIGLVEPLRDVQSIQNRGVDGIAKLTANVVSVAGAVGSSLALPALGSMIGMMAFQFLRSIYQTNASTATYLASYIVDLTFKVFYELWITLTATVDPPRSLSIDLVRDTLALFKVESPKIHDQVKDVSLSPKLEERVVKVIRDALRT